MDLSLDQFMPNQNYSLPSITQDEMDSIDYFMTVLSERVVDDVKAWDEVAHMVEQDHIAIQYI